MDEQEEMAALRNLWNTRAAPKAEPVEAPPARDASEDAAMRADAERYRWLREGDYTFPTERSLRDGRGWLLTGDDLDAAVDAARQERKP